MEYLKQEYERQALEKYCNGDYKYKGTNDFFARIQISIEIKDNNNNVQEVTTGWVLKQNGEIDLTTPFPNTLGKRYTKMRAPVSSPYRKNSSSPAFLDWP